MTQYKVGTVTVTNGSATVTGSGTAWVANVPVGSYFVVAGDVVAYQVASRTNTQITLTAPYSGSSGSGRSYVAHVDFHSNGAPSFLDDDIESAAILNRWLVQSWPAAAFGTAATRNVMTSLTDTNTPDALMPRGAFGVGGQTTDQSADASNLPTRFIRFSGDTPRPVPSFWHGFHISRVNNAQGAQFAVADVGSATATLAAIRHRDASGTFSAWQELYHTGNLGTSDTAWTTVTSLQNGWTGRVRYIKRGGIVVINADQLNGASATSSTILSISSSYTPSVDQYAISIEGSSGASRRVTASGLGIIVLSGNRSTITDSAFRITYPVIP